MKNKVWIDDADATLDDVANRYLGERYRFQDRRRLTAGEQRFSTAIWQEMAGMGWLSVSTPEEHGGLGLRVASVCLLSEAAGRALVQEPLVSSGVLAACLIASHASAAQRDALLAPLHAGALRVAYAAGTVVHSTSLGESSLTGQCDVVIDADIADHFIVRTGSDQAAALYLVEAGARNVVRRNYPLLDGRGAATIHLEGARAVRLGGGDLLDLRPALRLAALATASDSHGAMSAAFDLTLDYLKTRQQFGKSLGTHQVLQHRAVNMFIQLNESRAVLDQAIESLQAGTAEAARDVHAAKSLICESARLLAHEAVQLHGGIGITEEYAVSHYLRRIRVNEQLYGSAESHFMEFAASLESKNN